ncbi:DNA polymerase I [Thiohalospira halophila DSM 15071]|uniref:DNA polymerase I n=1 Tax=Thiohalospira halophila DSM 15071 TaxID=1123397 RepID=A0A1I1RM64_9GAMM|nr:DNA polymerase I [Thiohalospira halophila]SFD33388.1 DNA polymerase I [Thiohalospira halophila DSM 15071]
MAAKPLVLVDGSSYLYRAFHAMPALTSSAGEPTGATYGVINMLRRLLREYEPERMAVVFDAPGKTFRDDLYADYKANRPPMPDELSRQVEAIHQLVDALGLPRLVEDGVEADDVIATLARRAAANGTEVLISTGDKDLAQLVNDHITLVNTMNDTVLDREAVLEKFGVPPERIVDYLALVGDTSDNIPGVEKVGPKTAVKWLNEYGDLDGVIAAAPEMKGKIGENLRDALERLPRNRELVTVRDDVALDRAPADLERASPDPDALESWYRRLEFQGWLSDLLSGRGPEADGDGDPAGEPESGERAATEVVRDREALDAWVERLRTARVVTLDTETTSLEVMRAALVGIAVADGDGAAYIPVAHADPGPEGQLDRATVLDALRPVLTDPDRPKLGHNLKYDLSILARAGVELAGVDHDTMLESYVLDSTGSRHDLDTLALKHLGRRTTSFEAVAGKGAKQVTFDQVPLETAAPYAAEDVEVTRDLHARLWPELQGDKGLAALYRDIEMPLVPVLARMERRGVRIDRDLLGTISAELAERMGELERAAHDAAGQSFNLASPKQIQTILFEEQGLPVKQRTPKGQPSTAEAVLQELADDGWELPRLILEHRGYAKLKSTYTDKLPELINPETGRIHTSLHQAVTATGRLSSADPNLQNIPVRSETGKRIRQAFIAAEGCRLVAADYSQIELRIMAHLSGDEGLKRAFAAGEDIHRATAAEVFDTPPDQVGEDQRRAAKAINFGLIYGMSAWGLARQLGIERDEAQSYVDRYFERYPGVRTYMDETRERARSQGWVETVFGRRLHLPEIHAGNAQRRQYAERTAINAPMQGTAADIIKRAMIEVEAWLQGPDAPVARMVLQVHDELILEVAEGAESALTDGLRERMTAAADLAVPLEVEVGIGANWGEAH